MPSESMRGDIQPASAGLAPESLKEALRCELRGYADTGYRDFAASLIPGVDKERMLGVRLPRLREIAKRLAKQGMITLPAAADDTFEETMVRGMLPGYANSRPVQERMAALSEFARRSITNWSLCDSCCATCKFVREHREEAWKWLQPNLRSRREYVARFGVVMLLNHFVQDAAWAERTAAALPGVTTRHHYAAMAVAWCACELILRHPALSTPLLSPGGLDATAHALTLRKLRESHKKTNKR